MVAKANEAMPKVSGAPSMSALTSFNLSGLDLMHSLVLPLVLIFTVANSIVPSLAEGGSKYKVLNNLAITASISGASLLFLPVLADALFKSAQMWGSNMDIEEKIKTLEDEFQVEKEELKQIID